MSSDIGKEAEEQIRKWLDRPSEGYSLTRLYDQMNGFYGSKNICDFILYRYPNIYYIESKATWEDRFDFSMLTDTQHDGLLDKSEIEGAFGVVIVLFASYKRAFTLNINDIKRLEDQGQKSLNIKKIDKWRIPYQEIQTVPNPRKKLLDYEGEFVL